MSGRIVLRGPPAAAMPTEAGHWRRRIANRDIEWSVVWYWKPDLSLWRSFPAPSEFVGDTAAVVNQLERQPRNVRVAVMLDALEDSDRFAAAHVWLMRQAYTGPFVNTGRTDVTPQVSIVNGLRAEIVLPEFPRAPVTQTVRPDELRFQRATGMLTERRVLTFQGTESRVHIDPAQLPGIRRQWHAMLDRRVLSIRYWAILSALTAPWLVWFFSRNRRRLLARASAGQCLNCGYDLRASGARCPECGREVPEHPRA
ncbi:MAG TPA: hypothetical protein VH475_02035 [Tepidisphaeraceae bacterium]|jgi:hypothetical protein